MKKPKYINADEYREYLIDGLEHDCNIYDSIERKHIRDEQYQFAISRLDEQPEAVINYDELADLENRKNDALKKIRDINLCDLLYNHGACSPGCGEPGFVCVAQLVENIVRDL